MNADHHITKSLCDILQVGILRIRHFANAGHIKECFIEADHIHNLPQLIMNFRRDALVYYLDVERPVFVAQVSGSYASFEEAWVRLENLSADST